MVPESPGPRDSFRRRIVATGGIGLVVLLAIGVAAWSWATRHAAAATDRGAAQMATAQAGLLASELQKYRVLPIALAEYSEMRGLLAAPDAAGARSLDAKLELLADRTDAPVIYIIDADGRAVAASNWRTPTSFVGQDYRFRPYFRDAMRSGQAEMFGLGTVSKRPGLYIARRIGDAARPLGVIVVKVEFDRLEALWAGQPGVTLVTDRNDVVVITSRTDWRFRAMHPLDPTTRRSVRQTAQYGRRAPAAIGLVTKDGTVIAPDGGRYRVAELPTPLGRGRLRYYLPVAPAQASANASARGAVLIAAILLLAILALVAIARERSLAQASARRDLEREVGERTRALHLANARLVAESEERERINQRFRAAREELAQANRLGTLGQVTAGVAHEINQPTAAIQTFAANAQQFLARGMINRAAENLATIGTLTARIGTITAELRTFSRRRTPTIGTVPLDATIEGVLLLIGDRLKAEGITLVRSGAGGLSVIADRVRLEQIVVNLIQNACDALADRPDPRVTIAVARDERVRISVADNGPGIDPALADDLFTPFVTGRPDGLGLGLGIARDIAREFGGDLALASTSGEGATFVLTLRPA